MIRSALFFVLVLFVLPGPVYAEKNYLEVIASGNRLPGLAVAPIQRLAGAEEPGLAKEIRAVLDFDLSLSGLFTMVLVDAIADKSGIRTGEFDFEPWRVAGVDLLIKAGYQVDKSAVTLEMRLYSVSGRKLLAANRYLGKMGDLRKMAHTFADEVLFALTGERGPFSAKIAFVSKASGNKEIYLADFDGFNPQKLTNNGFINLNPDFAPNGREIVYTSYKNGNPDLYRREIYSGAETRIAAQRGSNIGGTWSPDGSAIALSSSKDGNAEIYVITKEGRQLARLTTNPAIDVSPTWSPDASQLAFVSDRLGKPQVFVMDKTGNNVRRLTTNGTYNVSPRWSPKGDRILYCQQQGGGFQIFSIATDGSGATQLTFEGSNEHPRWSPDGRFIIFSSTRGAGEALYIMRSDGSSQIKVSRTTGSHSHPTWGPH